jgi:hypothetical protein
MVGKYAFLLGPREINDISKHIWALEIVGL